jgi:D-serine deaminase-like pyridoxal phosphate-dependent protein
MSSKASKNRRRRQNKKNRRREAEREKLNRDMDSPALAKVGGTSFELRDAASRGESNPRLMEECKTSADVNREARYAAQLLSLGIIPEEQAAELYEIAALAAKKAYSAGHYGSMASCIKVLQSGADQELRALNSAGRQLLMPQSPTRSSETAGGAFLEEVSQSDLRETAKVLADLGILDALAKKEEDVVVGKVER